jgi:hypothetical protein
MPKLRLKLEALDVQSFDTVKAAPLRGASVETFQPWCTDQADCTALCTQATQPVALCASVPGEVCPVTGTGTV